MFERYPFEISALADQPHRLTNREEGSRRKEQAVLFRTSLQVF